MGLGWVKLHREVMENKLWLCEAFSRGQAWTDLILLANFETSTFQKRGIWIEVKRGQVGYSEMALAARWKWSRSKVDRFLIWLKNEHQIEHEKTAVTTLITILNYEKYQSDEQENELQTNIKKASNEHQTNTSKERKEKEERKEYTSKEKVKKETLTGLEVEVRWPFESENFKAAWKNWIDYRTEKKVKNYKSRGLQAALKKLCQDANGDEQQAIEIINFSMSKNWDGLFPEFKKTVKNQNTYGKSRNDFSPTDWADEIARRTASNN